MTLYIMRYWLICSQAHSEGLTESLTLRNSAANMRHPSLGHSEISRPALSCPGMLGHTSQQGGARGQLSAGGITMLKWALHEQEIHSEVEQKRLLLP